MPKPTPSIPPLPPVVRIPLPVAETVGEIAGLVLLLLASGAVQSDEATKRRYLDAVGEMKERIAEARSRGEVPQ